MKKAIITIILLLTVVISAHSSELSLGAGYPYFSVKYRPLELRYATGEGIKVIAGRFYLYFCDNNAIRGYTGVEGGYLKFNTLDMKGTGYEGSLFIGGECFVTESLSLSADIAPTYIGLKSEDSYKASGMEIVANICVNYYFSRDYRDNVKSTRKIKKAGEDEETTVKKKKAVVEDEEAIAEENEEVAEDEEDTEEEATVASEKSNGYEKTNNDKLINSYLDRASRFVDEEEYKMAIAEYKKVLRLDPENETASEEIERIKELFLKD
ncbi:MAG: hypothetical protein PHV60_07420 [bacterium]|nr:hypothetical protein [bacterium]